MREAERVARGLERKHRNALIRAEMTPEGMCLGQSCQEEECDDLEALGVTGVNGWNDILTPLGLEVRQILKGERDAG